MNYHHYHCCCHVYCYCYIAIIIIAMLIISIIIRIIIIVVLITYHYSIMNISLWCTCSFVYRVCVCVCVNLDVGLLQELAGQSRLLVESLSGTDLGEPLEVDTAYIMLHPLFAPRCWKTNVRSFISQQCNFSLDASLTSAANMSPSTNVTSWNTGADHWDVWDKTKFPMQCLCRTSLTFLWLRLPINSFRSCCASPESTKDPHASADEPVDRLGRRHKTLAEIHGNPFYDSLATLLADLARSAAISIPTERRTDGHSK